MTSDNIKNYDSEENEVLNEALEIFRNAKNKKYRCNKNIIDISYELNNEQYNLKYNINKGVFIK